MEKHVEILASLLEKEPEVVEEALGKEGEIDSMVSEYKSSHKIYTSEDLAKKIENANREYVEKLATDGKPIPSHIYNFVKGNAFEKQEKEWAREYGIEKWDNIDDLKRQIIEKEIAKSGKAVDDGVLKSKDEKIKELKDLLLASDEEKNKAIETERGRIGSRMIDFDIENAVNVIDIDAEGEKLVNQRSILVGMFRQNHKLEFNHELNRTVVSDKDGNLLKNKVGDPLSVSEVMTDFAPKWVDVKEVSKGGRGASSTSKKPDGGDLSELKDLNELVEYAEKKGIKRFTAEFRELMVEAQKANPAIQY
jgi:hypothetical protein